MNNSRLLKLLKGMNIPSHRKKNLDKHNLVWLSKYLEIKNSNHKNYKEIMKLITNKLNNNDYLK